MSISHGSLDYGRFDELAEEFANRYRRGERPSLQEYIDRLPEMAAEFRDLFPAMVEVEQADGDARRDPVPPPAVAPQLGQIGDYRTLREIGRGGMGVVYEAEQISLGRRVALKVLPAHVVGDGKTQARFVREAKAAARLHHTNIVPVFEVGRERDVSFYAMQLIQGQGLEQVIDELRRLRESVQTADPDPRADVDGLEEPATVTRHRPNSVAGRQNPGLGQMAELLLSGRLATEARGSDASNSPQPADLVATESIQLKTATGRSAERASSDRPPAATASESPSSAVMPGGKHVSEVDTSGRRQPFFRSVAQIGQQAAQGLAHAHARGVVHRDIKPSNLLLDTAGVVWITDFGLAKAEDDGLTATGDILGTLRYMAPERFRGEGDARADIYALGLTLYELLTLRPAFDSSDRLKLIAQMKAQEPARPRSIDGRIPRDLETIVLKAIDKDPDRRYRTADAMAEDLRRFLADEPIEARRASTVERYGRWARRNPIIAVLGGVLAGVLLLATVGSLLAAGRFAQLAERAQNTAEGERAARQEASRQADAELAARTAAQAETYRAMLSEAKALRAGRQLGWREEALANLARLAVMPTVRRDLVELRTEAAASIGEFGVKEVARFRASGNIVYSLDFSPDSRTLATATNDGNLNLWGVSARKETARLLDLVKPRIGGMGNGGLVRFLPDGSLAILNSSDQVVFLESSGRRSARLPIARGSAKALKLEFDRRRATLAVGWNDGRIDLHDARTGALQRSVEWKNPWDFALSPEGQWLAIQNWNGPVRLVPTGAEGAAFALGRGSGFFPALAFSPEGTTLASIDGRKVVIWDLASRQESLTLSGHKESVTAIAFSPDGLLVASSCGDSMTRIWDARDGRLLAALPGPWYMRRLAFSPDGEFLAASADPGPVCLYQLEGRREERRLVGHNFGALSVAFHPRLPQAASASDDNHIMLWNINDAKPLRRWKGNASSKGLVYSPDGSLLACGRSANEKDRHEVWLWDPENAAVVKILKGHQDLVNALTFDATGSRLASGDRSGTVLLWDTRSGGLLRREKVGNSAVASIEFYNGGRHLLVGLGQGQIALFDLERSDPPRRVASPDGCGKFVIDYRTNRAIVGDAKGGLVALSLPDLTVVHRLARGHDEAIVSLALSHDQRLLVSSGMDRRVVLRDSTTFEALLTFPAWTGVVRDLNFDFSGRWLAFAGSDSDLCLWDVLLLRSELASLGLAWDQPAPAVDVSPDIGAVREHLKTRLSIEKK